MKAWLYQQLNFEAKQWPYHKGNRKAQRDSIKSDLDMIRKALATYGAHATRGHGGISLYFARGASLTGASEMDHEPDLADAILFCDGASGVYIPQRFAQEVKRDAVTHVSDKEWKVLETGSRS